MTPRTHLGLANGRGLPLAIRTLKMRNHTQKGVKFGDVGFKEGHLGVLVGNRRSWQRRRVAKQWPSRPHAPMCEIQHQEEEQCMVAHWRLFSYEASSSK